MLFEKVYVRFLEVLQTKICLLHMHSGTLTVKKNKLFRKKEFSLQMQDGKIVPSAGDYGEFAQDLQNFPVELQEFLKDKLPHVYTVTQTKRSRVSEILKKM